MCLPELALRSSSRSACRYHSAPPGRVAGVTCARAVAGRAKMAMTRRNRGMFVSLRAMARRLLPLIAPGEGKRYTPEEKREKGTDLFSPVSPARGAIGREKNKPVPFSRLLADLEAGAVFGVDHPAFRVAVGVPHSGPFLRDGDGFAGVDHLYRAVGGGQLDAAFQEVHELVYPVWLRRLEPDLAGLV